MSDIVERLRSAFPNTIAQHEAADEIMRLRQRVAELEVCAENPVAWTVPGLITDFSRDFSMYETKTYTIPLYTKDSA